MNRSRLAGRARHCPAADEPGRALLRLCACAVVLRPGQGQPGVSPNDFADLEREPGAFIAACGKPGAMPTERRAAVST